MLFNERGFCSLCSAVADRIELDRGEKPGPNEVVAKAAHLIHEMKLALRERATVGMVDVGGNFKPVFSSREEAQRALEWLERVDIISDDSPPLLDRRIFRIG